MAVLDSSKIELDNQLVF